MYKIIETCNFGKDYPNESFLNLPATPDRAAAERIARAINDAYSGVTAPRFWNVVDADYELQPGFEP